MHNTARKYLPTINVTPVVEDMIAKYPDLFKDKLEILNACTGKLTIDPDTKPIFYKAQHVPFALLENMNKKLDPLESNLNLLELLNLCNIQNRLSPPP